VEVVGTASALELLDVRVVSASSVATGRGMVRTTHGLVPNPSPAVVELLEGIPTHGRDTGVELTTPTGAAMLAAWGSAFGPMPPMTIESAGYGAGARDLDEAPNCTQVVIGLPAELAGSSSLGQGQPFIQLEANLAELAVEGLADTLQSLVDYGAIDAWVTPVLSREGKPHHVVSLLCDPVLVSGLRFTLEHDMGATVLRLCPVEVSEAPGQLPEVDVAGYRVRVRISPGRVKVDHADAARVAEITGTPLREIAARAEAAWNALADTAKTPPRDPAPAPITPMRP
jgi:hypothetical protein